MTGGELHFDIVGACSLAGDGPTNEDVFGWTSHSAWVLDGATGVTHEILDFPSDASWFVRSFSYALQQALITSPEAATIDILNSAITVTRTRYEAIAGEPIGPGAALPSAAMVLARGRGSHIEISTLGDCKALYRAGEGRIAAFYDPSLEPFENRTLKTLRELRERAPDAPQSALREQLHDVLVENRRAMNRDDGYRVLSLTALATESLRQTEIAADDEMPLLLASDGFLRYTDVFELGSYGDLFRRVLGEGPTPAVAAVRAAEADDPECRRHVRVKPRDDATCLLLRLT